MANIILYDLPSKGRCASWSLNPWKTRLALNYKGVEYETIWLEAPEVAPTLKPLGIEPNPEGKPYTVPAVRFPDGTYTMESRKIASELERRYPTPALPLDPLTLEEVQDMIPKLMGPMMPVFAPVISRNVLNPASAEYYGRTRTRTEKYEETPDEMEKDSSSEETAWVAVEAPLKELADILQREEGPFVLGRTVSYADFVVVAFLHFVKRADEAILERAVGMEPSLGVLYNASRKWLERDD